MHLDVVIEDKTHRVEIPDGMLTEAEDFFQKMDRDMDHGWQMGPEFIEQPDRMQRCQIAANKLLTSISGENQLLTQLMAAYILKRLPGVKQVNIDTFGEMLHTEFEFEGAAARSTGAAGRRPTLSEPEARALAEKDVSEIYKVGKAWRFAMYDRGNGQWTESPFLPTEDEARRMRDEARTRLIARLQQA